jgi:hypothetical protein
MSAMIGETPEEYQARQVETARLMKLRLQRPEDPIRKRRRERSIITAVLLGAFVVLVFGISVAKIKLNW